MSSSKLDVLINNNKLRNLTESLTCHGLPNVVRNENKAIKFIWLLFFLAFFCFSSLTCIQSFISYFNYDVVNKIQFNKNTNDFLLFPVVSVCSLNPFVTQNSIKLVEKILLDLNVTDIVISNILDNSAGFYLNEHLTFTRFLLQSQLYNLSDEIKKTMVNSIEDMLINCEYGLEKCSVKDFEWFYMFDYGSCYKFKKNLISRERGKSNGLKLEMYFKQPSSINSLTFSNGIHVFINNQTIEPLRAEGIDVSVGYDTNVAIRKINHIKLPAPYSDCVNQDINEASISYLYTLTLLKYGRYKRRSCFDMCYQSFITENCKCYAILFPNINDIYEPCGLSVEKNRCNLIYHVIFYRNVSQIRCPALCPNECESVDFNIKLSFSSYPSKPYLDSLNKKIKNTNLNGSVSNQKEHLSLNIYYDSLDVMMIKEAPKYSFLDLIGSIGGSIGLYTGMSILSLFEFIEILYEFLIHLFTTIKN